MSLYQSYLKDCNCSSGGIIIHDGIVVCRWCRTPYAKGGCIGYEDSNFKKAVPDVELDYEILAVKFDGKIYDQKHEQDKPDRFFNHDGWWTSVSDRGTSIHSVKYLPTGEVFEVGSKVLDSSGHVCTIKSFDIDSNWQSGLRVSFIENEGGANGLCNIKHMRIPLFKTADNVDIFEGDMYYFVDTDNYSTGNFPAYRSRIETKGHVYFSTEKAANDYVLLNKPCLSIKEILDWLKLEKAPHVNTSELQNLVKSRL